MTPWFWWIAAEDPVRLAMLAVTIGFLVGLFRLDGGFRSLPKVRRRRVSCPLYGGGATLVLSGGAGSLVSCSLRDAAGACDEACLLTPRFSGGRG